MELGLGGKVAAVAAGSAGLGFGSAFQLASEGCKVGICGRRESKLKEAADRIQTETGSEVFTLKLDISEKNSPREFVRSVAEHFGSLDIVVANAGGPPSGLFENMTDDQWTSAVQLNFLATAKMFHEAIPYLRKSTQGRLVAITSMSAKQPIENLVLSNATRAGVHGLVKTLSRELAVDKITANVVCPGVINTDRIRELAEQTSKLKGISVDQAFEERAKPIPLGRLGDPMEFGAAVAFLCSSKANYISGIALPVDGGLLSGLP